MSDNQERRDDLLDEAIHAFQRMSVPQRPLDEELITLCGSRQSALSGPSYLLMALKRRHFMHVVLSSAAAALFLFGGVALYLRNSSPPESVQVAANRSSDKAGNDGVHAPPRSEKVEKEGLGSLKQHVADAQVIVVATALDSTPAPSKQPGDLPEVLIRFQVKRVLKGEWVKKEVITRTPTAADEFIGKDWVILLSPDYLAGKYLYAGHMNVKLEPTVKSYLPKDESK